MSEDLKEGEISSDLDEGIQERKIHGKGNI